MKWLNAIACVVAVSVAVVSFAASPVTVCNGRTPLYNTYSPEGKLQYSETASFRISNDSTYVYMAQTGAGEPGRSELRYYIYGRKLWIPMRSNLQALSDELCRETVQTGDSDMRIGITDMSGSDLYVPFDVREGDKLVEAATTCRMRVSDDTGRSVDMPAMSIKMKGEVLAPRRIATPAGDFDCSAVRISVRVKMSIVSMTEYMILYFVPDTGMVVREESVTRKGDISEYMQLESLPEP